MSTARFTYALKIPISKHAFKTRTFRGTITVKDSVNDLAMGVIGMLRGIAEEESISDVKSLRITASLITPRKRKSKEVGA